jgi:hypothetical protein
MLLWSRHLCFAYGERLPSVRLPVGNDWELFVRGTLLA